MDCFIAVALKRRSPDQQHQCNLGRCWKYKFSGLTSETLGWGPAVGVFIACQVALVHPQV